MSGYHCPYCHRYYIEAHNCLNPDLLRDEPLLTFTGTIDADPPAGENRARRRREAARMRRQGRGR